MKYWMEQQPFNAGFNPRSLAGLKLWLDAADGSTITIATGVSQWNDKSGNTNNATQATGASQPVVATAAQNGLNTIHFTSTPLLAMGLASAIDFSSAGYTIYLVGERDTVSASLIPLGSPTPAGTPAFAPLWSSQISSCGTGNKVISVAESALTYNQVTIQMLPSGGNGLVRFNGVDVTGTASSVGTYQMSGISAVGQDVPTSLASDGHLAELLSYSGIHSLANMQAAERYLKQKWGTP